ncbi:FecR/PupR family sigma factor regulator, partial [Stenotrophomonas sp.]
MTRDAYMDDTLLFERASAWVARLEAPDCTSIEREAFEDWLAEHPSHVTAWAQAEKLHLRSAGLSGDPWLRTAAARAARTPTRRWLPSVAA